MVILAIMTPYPLHILEVTMLIQEIMQHGKITILSSFVLY